MSKFFNKKCGIGVLVAIVLCVILGVLLGVLLPRSESESSTSFTELPESSPWYGNEEIRILREYLTYPTISTDYVYEPCVEFLKKQARSLELPVSVYYPVNDKNPVVVISWIGSDPSLDSIMLNSHTDVVPVFEEFWTHSPFAAEVDDEGRIFARGAQDTKALGTMYLGAIRALQQEGTTQLKRTFHITFVPDEEMGGFQGMAGFVQTDDFRNLKVGYALDEGQVSIDSQIIVYNDERSTWRIEFICHGVTGHGSILFENTTGEKITYLINKFMEKRQAEVEKMNNGNLPYANVTTINLTILNGGVQGNVIPPELSVTFDVRLAVDADHDEFERNINQWCEEAGGDITINYLMKDPKTPMTRPDSTNPLWVVLENTTRELNLTIAPRVPTGAADLRYLRRLGIPAFGFTPLINTPNRLHDHDEFVQAGEYLAGINVLKHVIANLGEM